MSSPTPVNEGRNAFPFERRNYLFFLLGLGLLAAGYLLMSEGGVEDPNEFSEAIFCPDASRLRPSRCSSDTASFSTAS